MMDRLTEVERWLTIVPQDESPLWNDFRWLIEEVKRLRAIEDGTEFICRNCHLRQDPKLLPDPPF